MAHNSYVSGVPFVKGGAADTSVLNKLLFNDAATANNAAVKWAVEMGAPLGEQNGGIPLLNAVERGNKQAAVLLLSLGADPNLLGISVR